MPDMVGRRDGMKVPCFPWGILSAGSEKEISILNENKYDANAIQTI